MNSDDDESILTDVSENSDNESVEDAAENIGNENIPNDDDDDMDDIILDDEDEENDIAMQGGSMENDDDDDDGTGKHNIEKQDDDDEDNETDKQNIEKQDDDDDDDDLDEKYLQKFDIDINTNYISKNHPECLTHNYEEIAILTHIVRDSSNIIIDDFHKTVPFLTKYERARILGQRAKQINSGSRPFVKVPDNVFDGAVIAEIELRQKRIPFIIRRPLPGGGCEYWNVKDLENIAF
jgi:DNA-directed RNA polymerase I, II, and III subunit RPABC2